MHSSDFTSKIEIFVYLLGWQVMHINIVLLTVGESLYSVYIDILIR